MLNTKHGDSLFVIYEAYLNKLPINRAINLQVEHLQKVQSGDVVRWLHLMPKHGLFSHGHHDDEDGSADGDWCYHSIQRKITSKGKDVKSK